MPSSLAQSTAVLDGGVSAAAPPSANASGPATGKCTPEELATIREEEEEAEAEAEAARKVAAEEAPSIPPSLAYSLRPDDEEVATAEVRKEK
jgi:hypothetical protein